MSATIHTDIQQLFADAKNGETGRVSAFMLAYTVDENTEIDKILVEFSKHGLHLPGGKANPKEFELFSDGAVSWFYDRTLLRELSEESSYALLLHGLLFPAFVEQIDRTIPFPDGVKRNVHECVTYGLYNGPTDKPIKVQTGGTTLAWMPLSQIRAEKTTSSVLRAAIMRLDRLFDDVDLDAGMSDYDK